MNKRITRLLIILAVTALVGGLWALPRVFGGVQLPQTLAASADTAERPFQTLKKGGSGEQVRRAQEALSSLGYYSGRIDGNFSRAFEEAVIAFQEDFGLTADGKIDEETYLLITADLPAASPAPTDAGPTDAGPQPPAATEAPFVVRYEDYSDKEHVAAYLHEFGELPPNYLTKQEARELGWVESWGNLWQVAPEMSIGGDYFGNYEGKLPRQKGRRYFECDIDYDPAENRGRRNGKRIIYSSDGLIFYTEDHYETFEEITFP